MAFILSPHSSFAPLSNTLSYRTIAAIDYKITTRLTGRRIFVKHVRGTDMPAIHKDASRIHQMACLVIYNNILSGDTLGHAGKASVSLETCKVHSVVVKS